ncbi:hypothetical protein [Mycolicibacterium peregrinum]|uniref:hypothetical protein n=1 Tax=Mycolicibacterium peregrinum TaxID=43304 RepID=UPI003AAB0458
MSDARERVAEAICSTTSAGKLFPWSESTEHEREPWRRMADAAIAAHLVEVGQGGYVVVALPEPVEGEWRIREVGNVALLLDACGVPTSGVRITNIGFDLTVHRNEARSLAAALLAAADAAEASR